MTRQHELVLASTNVHKVRELKAMLKRIGVDLLSLIDFPDYKPEPETGSTFEDNAIRKATHAAAKLQRWVLAEDSGLIVPALAGAPGVFSARYAGESATDADNRKKLLDSMQALMEDDRSAYFECCMAFAGPDGLKKTTRGLCEGSILVREKGGGGFGYDPLFVKHGYSKSFAELEEAVKNRISHRRKALDRMWPALEAIFCTT